MRSITRPMPFGRTLNVRGALVAAALMLAACAGVGDQPGTSPPGSGDEPWGPLAVVPPSDGGDGALIEGVLDVTEDCVLLNERGNDVLLVWPADRVGWDAEAETVAFESSRGQVVTFGDGVRVTFGGGGSSVEEGGQSAEQFIDGLEWVSQPDPECVVDTRWIVSDIVP